MRIGHGYDVHRFGEGEYVVLGGVKIAYPYGLVAHSDGDVLLHALADALLGACGLGDIGHHFPDNDPQYAGADSRELLRRVYAHVAAAGFTLGNADITVIAQAPKLAPHIDTMRQLIHDRVTEHEMSGYARRESPGIRDDARDKVLSGVSTVQEIFRVTLED